MRFVSFKAEDWPSYGIAHDRGIFDLGARLGDIVPDLRTYLEAAGRGLLAPPRIEYVTAFTPLSAGDVIVTGTPGGVGDRRKPPLYMKAGDTVEVSIEGVGRLINDVKDEADTD